MAVSRGWITRIERGKRTLRKTDVTAPSSSRNSICQNIIGGVTRVEINDGADIIGTRRTDDDRETVGHNASMAVNGNQLSGKQCKRNSATDHCFSLITDRKGSVFSSAVAQW